MLIARVGSGNEIRVILNKFLGSLGSNLLMKRYRCTYVAIDCIVEQCNHDLAHVS